jgi:hypothetical protein
MKAQRSGARDKNSAQKGNQISIERRNAQTRYTTVVAMHDQHGLINYKDTKTKYRRYWCLIEFIDWI